jgi:rfaE bifunctional protein kinase chain/domain
MSLRHVRPPATARLRRWPPAFKDVPVVVWGDFMLDEYWRCRTRRVSREAPVLVLEYEERTIQGGGAANAALNLAALGARVTAVGWVGRDAAGRDLTRALKDAGIDTAGLMYRGAAPTVVKTRIVAGDRHTARQQVVRVDRGTPFAPSATERRALVIALDRRARAPWCCRTTVTTR